MNENWTAVIEYDGIETVVRRAADRANRALPWFEGDDLEQVAWEILGERPELTATPDRGLLSYRLGADVIDRMKGRATTAWERERPISTIGVLEEDGYAEQPVELVAASLGTAFESELVWLRSDGLYAGAEIEYLLIGLWDDWYGYQNPWPMPSWSGPRPTRHPAMVADVRSAWHGALTTGQRKALFLTAALGFTQAEAGDILGVSQRAVSGLVERGLDRMLRALNGQPPAQAEVACAA